MAEAAIIEVNNVSKFYGSALGVRELSLSVQEGDLFALIGPNGAGKSTTIKMITTVTRPSSGRLRVAGADTITDATFVRRTIGVVFQNSSLDDDLTVIENLQLHASIYNLLPSAAATRIDDMLELVDLGGSRNKIVKSLSAGTKRRIEIIRAILHSPRILFLDEPTVGLDPQVRNVIWAHLKELNRSEGMTIFFTTHYMEEVEKHARTAAIIDHGQLAELGSVDSIIANRGCQTFEEAYLSVTGKEIREQKG